MIDPTPNEIEAMRDGGAAGGEYLGSIGQSELARLTTEQWQIFLECVITGYCDRLRELAAADQSRLEHTNQEVPF